MSRPRAWLLAAGLLLGAAGRADPAVSPKPAAGMPGARVPFGRLLAAYRADPLCYGPGFRAALHAVDARIDAYHERDAVPDARSRALGAEAAGAADALAATAAGKGCNTEALEMWRFVIRYFDGPAYTDYQREAVAGMRGLRGRHPG